MLTDLSCSRTSKTKQLTQVWLALLLIMFHDYRHSASDDNSFFGADALRVRGEFDLSTDFFLFLAKFGFQKTDIQDPNNTQGVIYGNVSLTVNDEEKMDIIYGNTTLKSYESSSGKIHLKHYFTI